MDRELVDAYLGRIGAQRPEEPNGAALRHLQERHVLSIPFDNLSFHLNEPILHGEDSAKRVVHEGRGGGCFELNTAFALLLDALGFQVEMLVARIYRGQKLSSAFGHMVLRVQTCDTSGPVTGGLPAAGDLWMVDVAQGGNSRWPLRIDSLSPQSDPHGSYRLVRTAQGDIDVLCDEVPLYCVETRPRDLEFCAPTIWWYQTSPDSPFRKRLLCVQPRTDGRVMLTGRILIRDLDGCRTREKIDDDEELKKVLQTYFGTRLDRLPDILLASA